MGHSYGGLVAEEWWEEAWGANDHGGVTSVFSLDAPINGVVQCTASLALQGSDVATEFCRRRESLTSNRAIDSNLLSLDRDHSYTAVGNVDDPAYGSPIPGGGIQDQVIYKCGHLSDADTRCVAIPPSLVLNANPSNKSCAEGSPSLYGTKGHDIVKACPTVVGAIVAAVKAAANSYTSSSTSPSPTPSPTETPEQQAQLAVVGHWLKLMDTTQSSQVVKDFNQVRGKQGMRTTLLVGAGTTPQQVVASTTPPGASHLSFEFHYVYRSPQIVKAPNLPLGEGVEIVVVDGDISLRAVAVTDSPESLSPADTANGIVFRGTVSIQTVSRWRSDARSTYSPFADYTYTAGVTLSHGSARFAMTGYDGAWVSGGFDGIEYPGDVPFSVACQLGAAGKYPDFVGSNGQPPAGC